MKKVIKIISIIIISILLIYILFVTKESIRLKHGGRQPLIILDGTCDGDKTAHTESKYINNCKGIGYRIQREYILGGIAGYASEDKKEYRLVREEFWLFDKFLIWGWIS